MSSAPSILVLHGITMNGASMLRALGPLGLRLEELGFTLVAPNAAHRLEGPELGALMTWLEQRYREAGQNARNSFCTGRFWDADHYDWFQSSTDERTGKKAYLALERSLDALAESVREREVVGLLGFSQGAAMATIVAALATRGDARFAGVRFGLFLSGFKPAFDAPTLMAYPAGPFRRLFVIGERDPIFPGSAGYLASLSQAFEGDDAELVVVPGLGHDVPTSPELVERLAQFALRARDG